MERDDKLEAARESLLRVMLNASIEDRLNIEWLNTQPYGDAATLLERVCEMLPPIRKNQVI